MHSSSANAIALEQEFQWFAKIIENRLSIYFQQTEQASDMFSDVVLPDLSSYDDMYSRVVREYNMSLEERVVLLLALAPHVCPQLLDLFFLRNTNYDRGFTQFGGLKGYNHAGFIPTVETALFLLAGENLEKRFQLLSLFSDHHYFQKNKILLLGSITSGEPSASRMLSVSDEYLHHFISNEMNKSVGSAIFPAQLVTTNLEWEDLVLADEIIDQVMQIRAWITHGHQLMEEWGMKKWLKPGYRAVFYGVAGTGKTLTAALLGKTAGLDVCKIDLSIFRSGHNHEIKQFISDLIDQAQRKNWILLFDLGDDSYSEKSLAVNNGYQQPQFIQLPFLLRSLENFSGVAIFIADLSTPLNKCFYSGLQSVIHFPVPSFRERKALWLQAFSKNTSLQKELHFDEIASRYEITGGAIMEVSRQAMLRALQRGDQTIQLNDLLKSLDQFERTEKSMG
jgi:hypothetical protein